MTKDFFQILTDEITLIRHDMANLQRTSLNKDEAKALHQQVTQGVDRMSQTGQAVYEALANRMDVLFEKLSIQTILAATDAASGAITKNHQASIFAAQDLSKAAGEARREAWRYFGGFWVWLASVGAAGVILGLLVAFWMTGRGDARAFAQHPSAYCASTGGKIAINTEGRKFCAVWIDPEPQAEN
jgi:hypothetical protein